MTSPKGIDKAQTKKLGSNEMDPSRALASPNARAVIDFHRNDDVDARGSSHHHTIGTGVGQASDGRHTHGGQDSFPLLSETITGSRTNNVGSILQQIMAELSKIGLVDGTTT
jgi:hypothetical protein